MAPVIVTCWLLLCNPSLASLLEGALHLAAKWLRPPHLSQRLPSVGQLAGTFATETVLPLPVLTTISLLLLCSVLLVTWLSVTWSSACRSGPLFTWFTSDFPPWSSMSLSCMLANSAARHMSMHFSKVGFRSCRSFSRTVVPLSRIWSGTSAGDRPSSLGCYTLRISLSALSGP